MYVVSIKNNLSSFDMNIEEEIVKNQNCNINVQYKLQFSN